MKTQEELIALANEIKELNRKLKELSEEELQMVIGGDIEKKPKYELPDGQVITGPHVTP